MKPICIIGAGFSGLTLAYSLRKLGVPVRVLEKDARAGGLIGTRSEEFGLVETAANALLADAGVEELFQELQVPFAARLPARKRRYIFWRKPRRWPLSFFTTLKLIKMSLLNLLGSNSILPRKHETVSEWAGRVVNAQFEERMLAPALQGVYAGDAGRMSGALSLGGFFAKSKRGRLRGSVAPRQGMGELIEKLTRRLEELGVAIEYGRDFRILERPEQPVVLCTSAWAASEIVRDYDPALSEILGRCEGLPLVTVTAFFAPRKSDRKGFGCLFPTAQNFHALGVLFNDSIFAGRSSHRSETWILGGALHPDMVEKSDERILECILADRARLANANDKPVAYHVTRRAKAIPHYTIEWEESLRHLKVNRPLFLHGNYLGQLGLAKIYERSRALASQIKDLYVS